MRETLAQRIMRHEGFVATPRPDARGMYVVGYGHDITAGEAEDYQALTEDEARELLDSDISRCQIEVARWFPWSSQLSRIRQDVLVEMVFQMGSHGVCDFGNFLHDLRRGEYGLARRALIDSLWHRQTPGRCEELASLIETGNQDEVTPWTRPPA